MYVMLSVVPGVELSTKHPVAIKRVQNIVESAVDAKRSP